MGHFDGWYGDPREVKQFLSPVGSSVYNPQKPDPIPDVAYTQPGVFANALSGASQAGLGAMGQAGAAGLGAMGAAAGAGLGAMGYAEGARYGTLGGLGNAYANAFTGYGSGLGSIANARANERSNLYGANAMAEAARQAAMANIGTAALGAYGGAANGALAAWAANQQAYNNSLAAMHTADQQSRGNIGSTRNAALSGLGNAYGSIGSSAAGANKSITTNMGGTLPGFGASFGGGGGGGFTASGPSGTVASGSYDAGGGGGGSVFGGGNFSLAGTKTTATGPSPMTDRALEGLADTRNAIMSPDLLARVDDASERGRAALDMQHYSSRGMPSQMLGQTLQGLLTLGRPSYESANAGMNQFYRNTRFSEWPYRQFASQLGEGFNGVNSQLGNLRSALQAPSSSGISAAMQSAIGSINGGMSSAQSSIGSALNSANQNIGDLWDKSMGLLPVFSTPAQQEERNTEGEMARRRGSELSRLADNLGFGTFYGGSQKQYMDHLNNIANSPWSNDMLRNAAAAYASKGRPR